MKSKVRSIIVRSITMVAGTLALMASVAVAQCGPKSDASPKAGMSGHGKSKTLVGVVTDSTCGRTHSMMPGKSDAECTRACITKGSKYALIVGDKVYTLEGQADALDKLAGAKAK